MRFALALLILMGISGSAFAMSNYCAKWATGPGGCAVQNKPACKWLETNNGGCCHWNETDQKCEVKP